MSAVGQSPFPQSGSQVYNSNLQPPTEEDADFEPRNPAAAAEDADVANVGDELKQTTLTAETAGSDALDGVNAYDEAAAVAAPAPAQAGSKSAEPELLDTRTKV